MFWRCMGILAYFRTVAETSTWLLSRGKWKWVRKWGKNYALSKLRETRMRTCACESCTHIFEHWKRIVMKNKSVKRAEENHR